MNITNEDVQVARKIVNSILAEREKEKRYEFFLNQLNIPYGHQSGPAVSIKDLVEIFNNPEKLKEIIRLLNNKSLW